jgi:hypothetical protein
MFRVSADVQSFHRALLAAARESGQPGAVLRLRMLRLFPAKLQELHDQCCEEVIEAFSDNPNSLPAGSVSYSTDAEGNDVYGINWDGLTNFLKEILPIILPIILKLLVGV